MRNDKQFIQQLVEVFPDRKVLECLSISDLDMDFIQDNEETQRCYFTEGLPDGFKIINQKRKEINLLSVDACFFSGNDGKRCDGIVFDNKEICFFELKLNVESTKGSKKRKHFDYAIEQLESTITFFQSNPIIEEMESCNLSPEAYICMNDNSYPTDNASKKIKKVAFLVRNKIPLFDRNYKEFV